jgi:hypothetical protein
MKIYLLWLHLLMPNSTVIEATEGPIGIPYIGKTGEEMCNVHGASLVAFKEQVVGGEWKYSCVPQEPKHSDDMPVSYRRDV